MKALFKIIAFCFISSLAFYACKKDGNNNINTTSNVTAFFDVHKAPLQTFKIGPNYYNSITGAKGTKVNIIGPAFTFLNGEIPTDSITIELREVLTKKDMILSGAFTVTGDRLLKSGGEIYLNATCNGKQLIPRLYRVRVVIPTTSTDNMNLYYGYGEAGININTTPLTWQIDTTGNVTTYQDSLVPGSYYYHFIVDSLEWINCDDVIDNGNQLVAVHANTSGEFNSGNTMVFISVDGMNSALRLYATDTILQSFSSLVYINSGLNVHLIAISEIGGQYYFCSLPYILTGTNNIAFTPLPANEADILSALDNLP